MEDNIRKILEELTRINQEANTEARIEKIGDRYGDYAQLNVSGWNLELVGCLQSLVAKFPKIGQIFLQKLGEPEKPESGMTKTEQYEVLCNVAPEDAAEWAKLVWGKSRGNIPRELDRITVATIMEFANESLQKKDWKSLIKLYEADLPHGYCVEFCKPRKPKEAIGKLIKDNLRDIIADLTQDKNANADCLVRLAFYFPEAGSIEILNLKDLVENFPYDAEQFLLDHPEEWSEEVVGHIPNKAQYLFFRIAPKAWKERMLGEMLKRLEKDDPGLGWQGDQYFFMSYGREFLSVILSSKDMVKAFLREVEEAEKKEAAEKNA